MGFISFGSSRKSSWSLGIGNTAVRDDIRSIAVSDECAAVDREHLSRHEPGAGTSQE